MKKCDIFIIILVLTFSYNSAITTRSDVKQFLASQNAARSAPLTWGCEISALCKMVCKSKESGLRVGALQRPIWGKYFLGLWEWVDASLSCRGVGVWQTGVQLLVEFLCLWTRMWDYTQIVWSETRIIGCAQVIYNDEKTVFMTCNYDPRRNYIGEKPYWNISSSNHFWKRN